MEPSEHDCINQIRASLTSSQMKAKFCTCVEENVEICCLEWEDMIFLDLESVFVSRPAIMAVSRFWVCRQLLALLIKDKNASGGGWTLRFGRGWLKPLWHFSSDVKGMTVAEVVLGDEMGLDGFVCDVHMLGAVCLPSWSHFSFGVFPMWSTRLKGQPCCQAIKMCRSDSARLQPCLHDITNVLFWGGSVLWVRGVTTHPCWVGSADSLGLVQNMA